MSSQDPNPNPRAEDREHVEKHVEEHYYAEIQKLQGKYEEIGKGQEFRTEWARMLYAGQKMDSIWFALAFKMHLYSARGENWGGWKTRHGGEEKGASEQQQDEAAKTECSDECECSKDPKECPPPCNDDADNVSKTECKDECECPKECPPPCNDDAHHVPKTECNDGCECPKECPPPCNDECECPK